MGHDCFRTFTAYRHLGSDKNFNDYITHLLTTTYLTLLVLVSFSISISIVR